MVELKPQVDAAPAPGLAAQPVVVPVETVRDFLSAHQITPAHHADGDNPTASVVRVICVRK
jgi:hypothetical protein